MQPAGYNAYQRIQTQTSSPGQLVVMLYNALVNDLQRAATALTDGGEERAHGSLVRAQDIVMELMASLDKTQGEELATQLADLYQYIYNRLVEANVKKDAAIVREVASLVTPLREAWVKVVSENSAGGPLAQAAG